MAFTWRMPSTLLSALRCSTQSRAVTDTLAQAEEAALDVEMAELHRALHTMKDDPVNRRRIYLTDREVCACSTGFAWCPGVQR